MIRATIGDMGKPNFEKFSHPDSSKQSRKFETTVL